MYHLLCIEVSPSPLVNNIANFSHQNLTDFTVLASIHNDVNIHALWHCCLGHLSLPHLKLITYPIVKNHISFVNEEPCNICPIAKFHHLPFYDSHLISSRIFEMVHSGIWGPCSIPAYNGSKIFFTIIDDFSHTT